MIPAIPWRLLGAVGLVAVVALAGWRVATWRTAYKALPAIEARLEAETACSEGSDCAARVARLRAAQEALGKNLMENYEKRLADLRSQPVPAAPVRLCRPARPGRVSGRPATGSADGAAPGRDVPLEVSRDIAGSLFGLADACDREVAKLAALQEWNRALSTK